MRAELHHISLPVEDLARSRAFYTGVLNLPEIARPRPFDEGPARFAGAWYQLGGGQLHLIVHDPARNSLPTYRIGKTLDTRDVHLALRVPSFAELLRLLQAKGYAIGHADDFRDMRVNPNLPSEGAGFPQVYILDPDRHIIEINAERLDLSPQDLEALGIGNPAMKTATLSEARRPALP